jgi:biopolymer transport protein ExbB
MSPVGNLSLIEILKVGGLVMDFLILCSLVVWAVIFERLWRYRRLHSALREFQLQALNALLRNDWTGLRSLCSHNADLPTARLTLTALERLSSKDERLRANWGEALERRRQLINQELRRNLWILGTIASAAPFIGLYGTVVGVLKSFNQMAQSGAGGFTVVAGGISEALVATAAGILVAVVALIAYNAFQTRWNALVLTIKLHTEELAEVLGASEGTLHGV